MRYDDGIYDAISALITHNIKKISEPILKEQDVKTLLNDQNFVDDLCGENNENFRNILNPFLNEGEILQEACDLPVIPKIKTIYGRLIKNEESKNSEY